MEQEVREYLRQIIAPLILAAILGMASLVLGIFNSIADPYTGNIYWKPSLRRPFSQNEMCFFTGFRVMNESSQPTKQDINFEFDIYKPADANFVPTHWRRLGRSKYPPLPSIGPGTKVILMGSSDVDTQFEVFTDGGTPWDGKQTFEGWLHIRASLLHPAIVANDEVDIVMLYWSYTPIQTFKTEPGCLTIGGIPYPDTEKNKEVLARQRDMLTVYWMLFLLLTFLAFFASVWVVFKFCQYRNKLKYEREKLAETLRKEEDKRHTLQFKHETESRLEKEFEEIDEEEEQRFLPTVQEPANQLGEAMEEASKNETARDTGKGEKSPKKKNPGRKQQTPKKKAKKKKPKKKH